MAGFPVHLGEVDTAWLTRSLRDTGYLGESGRVDAFEIAPIGSGFGQTGESARLLLFYVGEQPDAPASAFVKFATSDPVRRAASQRLDLYRREVDFYRRLARRVEARAPRCYFAAASPQGDLATVLLEDFPNHRPGDDLIGLQLDEAEIAADLLANLHAPFWGSGNELGVAPLSMGTRDLFAKAWQEAERQFASHFPATVRALRDRYLDAVEPLHLWLRSGPVTLGHGDVKLDNLLFGPGSNDPIVAVDWQAVRPQRGIRDLAYLVSHSMDVGLRRLHEHHLIERYRLGLRRHGVDYNARDARADFCVSMLFDFCTVLFICGVNLNTNERALRRKRALLDRSITALLDWNAFAQLDRFA